MNFVGSALNVKLLYPKLLSILIRNVKLNSFFYKEYNEKFLAVEVCREVFKINLKNVILTRSL